MQEPMAQVQRLCVTADRTLTSLPSPARGVNGGFSLARLAPGRAEQKGALELGRAVRTQ